MITFMIMFMIIFPPNRLQYYDLGHCVPSVVFMFCELVMFVLLENWHTEYLEVANCYSNISFHKFQT